MRKVLGAASIAAIVIATLLAPWAPAVAAASRPFPFHVTLPAGIIQPNNVSQAQMDAAVRRHWRAWKTNYLRSAGGEYWVKYDDTNSTVSEAHGYGMVLAAYLADRPLFNSMFRYFKAHPSVNARNLMAWKQTLQGGQMVSVEGGDSATDGDLDIAYALLLADVQWGSAGAIDYKAEALRVMRAILIREVNTETWTLTPGDWAFGEHEDHTRPSDFMTGHFLAFARADPANAVKWRRIYDAVARIVNYQFRNGSERTGLMPDFMVRSGVNFVPVPGVYLESERDGDFYYNACRTPWRLSMSLVAEGRTDMRTALRRQARWIEEKADGRPDRIRAGYYVSNGQNGTALPGSDYLDLAFVAPFAVNAMTGGPGSQTWLNRLWRSITGGDFDESQGYYGDAIRLQVMLTVSGNWWQP
jgi:hypothetical protein